MSKIFFLKATFFTFLFFAVIFSAARSNAIDNDMIIESHSVVETSPGRYNVTLNFSKPLEEDFVGLCRTVGVSFLPPAPFIYLEAGTTSYEDTGLNGETMYTYVLTKPNYCYSLYTVDLYSDIPQEPSARATYDAGARGVTITLSNFNLLGLREIRIYRTPGVYSEDEEIVGSIWDFRDMVFVDTDVEMLKNYTYRIEPIYDNGYADFVTVSIFTDVQGGGTINPSITAPSDFNFVSAAITESSITMYFVDNSDNEDEFIIEMATSSGWERVGVLDAMESVGRTLMFTCDRTLEPDTPYVFRVYASSGLYGKSAWVGGIAYTDKPTPDRPTLSAKAMSMSSIAVKCQPGAYTDNIIIERWKWLSENVQQFMKRLDTGTDTIIFHVLDTELLTGQKYRYFGIATNKSRSSGREKYALSYPVYVDMSTFISGPAPFPPGSVEIIPDQTSIEFNARIGMVSNPNVGMEIRTPNGVVVGFVTAGDNGQMSYTISSLTPNTIYRFLIYAFNTNPDGTRNYSSPYDTGNIRTPGPSDEHAASNLVISDSQVNRLTLTWQDNSDNETGFKISRGTSLDAIDMVQIAMLPPNTVTYTDNTVSSGIKYYYKVSAMISGIATQPAGACGITKLPTPFGLKGGSSNGTALRLFWNENCTNERGFMIQRRSSVSSDSELFGVDGANQCQFTDTGLTNGRVYYYKVRAFNADAQSDWSSEFVYTGGSIIIIPGKIMINEGATYTLSEYVNLNVSAPKGSNDIEYGTEMCFRDNDLSTYTAWEPYRSTKTMKLHPRNLSNYCEKTVYVKFRDSAMVESEPICAGIISAPMSKMTALLDAGELANSDRFLYENIIMSLGPGKGLNLYVHRYGTSTQVHSLQVCGKDVKIKSIVKANIDNNLKDDLIVDFGEGYGIWILYDGRRFSDTALHGLTAKYIQATDINNDGTDEVIIDFGEYTASSQKMWTFYPKTNSWRQFHPFSCDSMVSGNFDNISGKDLVVDFGIYGLWVFYNETYWRALHSFSADQILTGDINGDGTDEIIVDFGEQFGAWAYYPLNADTELAWKWIESQNPKYMAIGNCDEYLTEDVLFDLGSQSDFSFVSGSNTDVSGKRTGIHVYFNDTAQSRIHTGTSEGAIFTRHKILIDFGPQHGEFLYDHSSDTWSPFETVSAEN